MKKNMLKKLSAVMCLSLCVICTNTVFAETNTTNSKKIDISSFKVDEKMIEHLKAMKAAQENKNTDNNVTAFGPAPKLTYLEVYAAISTNYPQFEYFKRDQLLSNQDHGGAELYIVTAELGYGYSQIAKMNGNQLKEVRSEYIDLDGDRVIDGWYYWWDASGNESGQFTYQNTSTNSPWNTMSDWIRIQ